MHFFTKVSTLAFMMACTTPAVAQLNLPFGSQKEVDKLSKVDISKVVLFATGDINKCRSEHKKKEPKVSGKLVARFTVDPSGKTSNINIVSTEFKGSTFAKCLTGLIGDWSFPKSKQKSAPYDLPQTF
ncbi:MAG: AgmX/PglI C-terminal domain-containing protein [Betaproteobacteria bacterium]|nr:AgmX/PglI C-terminal domain-containing protein [Betaproteobacteria bacterium]